jgi:ribosomal protein L23
MRIVPILTEKSLNLAKIGKFTFWVLPGLTKNEIRKLVESVYEVHVTGIKTSLYKGLVKKNIRGRKVKVPARKKTVVDLAKDEKIDAFEVKGKKK